MLLLVTDTSGTNGTVALARAGEHDLHEAAVVEVAPLAGGTFSAQLVPQIATLLAKHGRSKADIDAFIVVSGPGSFTGLRVGLAAIKALAEILKKPIVPVSLLQLVASASRAQGRVVAALDGGRGEVFFGAYELAGESVQVLREELLSRTEFLAQSRESTIATPDLALAAAARDLGLSVCSTEVPNAEMIARFGWKKLQAAETISPELLEANYLRRSDAEMFVKNSS
ncbi:MAG TPA: tRNA (adenosine(37)-N6)-threonylcarbamoyltransferase complex dimerization subunit type 1 TsaB [Candidatus Sulfotelmatobacter sp.]|nr:tRNA (adenosine(37)-N6)-threonylcarbamoyltransferase complex dimerization subunit type 1 TsaB [Candidatus Sulfotelmatobacter sp.]